MTEHSRDEPLGDEWGDSIPQSFWQQKLWWDFSYNVWPKITFPCGIRRDAILAQLCRLACKDTQHCPWVLGFHGLFSPSVTGARHKDSVCQLPWGRGFPKERSVIQSGAIVVLEGTEDKHPLGQWHVHHDMAALGSALFTLSGLMLTPVLVAFVFLV